MPSTEAKSSNATKNRKKAPITLKRSVTKLLEAEKAAQARRDAGFPSFPKLPVKLRLKIWKLALPGPRIMNMQLKFDQIPPVMPGRKVPLKRTSRFASFQPPPVGLHVCAESRHEALKEYELAFPTTTTPPQTYVNFKKDVFILDTLSRFFPKGTHNTEYWPVLGKTNLMLGNDFAKIRTVLVNSATTWVPTKTFLTVYFASIETIGVVVDERAYYRNLERLTYTVEDFGATSWHWKMDRAKRSMEDLIILAQRPEATVSPEIRLVRLIPSSQIVKQKAKRSKMEVKDGRINRAIGRGETVLK